MHKKTYKGIWVDYNQDWLELYQKRDQWALTAYEKFINQVDDALKADLTRSDQITIVVYGSTQVGKTSLILKILGINDLHMAEVSKLLRGGREIGKSATIMPIRYRRSADDQWHIHDIKGKDTTVSTIEEYFKNLRENVEKAQTNTTNIIDVYIPQYYFSQQSDVVLDIRILDLPGTQALNKNEQHHVQQISAKYGANADLILLVGLYDDLAFVNPSRLMLDQFKHWTSQPSRFKVILTRAFSPSTIIDYVKQNQNSFTLDTFKDRIFQQLSTHDFQVPQECQDIIFPLEFGDSLENIKAKHSDYFALIDSVNQNSFKLLHIEICKAANPYSRFKNGFDVQRLAKVRIDEEKKRFNADSEEIDQKLISLRGVISSLQEEKNKIDSLKESHLLSDEYFSMIQGRYSFGWFQIQYIDLNQYYSKPKSHSVSSLKELAKKYASSLKNQWREVGKYIDKEEKDLNFSFGLSPSLDTENLKACNEKLESYLADTYWFDSTFEEDYQMLKNALQKQGKLFAREGWDQLTTYINQQRVYINQQCEKLEKRFQQLKYVEKQKLGEVFKLQEQQSDLKIRHQNFIARMETAQQHGGAFENLMKRSFEEAYQQSKTDFFNEQDPVKKFYRLWYSMLLETQYDEMMLGVKG